MKVLFNTVKFSPAYSLKAQEPVVAPEENSVKIKEDAQLPSYKVAFGAANKIDMAKIEKAVLNTSRNWDMEFSNRVEYIKQLLKDTHAKGIIYGNSGGKDCTLVSILCKAACDNTKGVIMPCGSKRNYGEDKSDALDAAKQYGIENVTVDLTSVRESLLDSIKKSKILTDEAISNIAPRLRMTTLYAIGQAENCLVAGTGNKSEIFMGYFTKHGDGACDFNPISDLTAGEVIEFLKHLNAPQNITTKAPSAGLYEGQTDEEQMGTTYEKIAAYMRGETVPEKDKEIIERYHSRSEHKRRSFSSYSEYAKDKGIS